MRIVVTGGCGFIGASLALHLKRIGHEITCLDSLSWQPPTHANLRQPTLEAAGVHVMDASIGQDELYDRPGFDSDLVIHCAGYPSAADMKRTDWHYNSNVACAFTVLEQCQRERIPLIWFSSSRIYPDASGARSIYGATKACGDILAQEYAHAFGIPTIINRCGCVAGPWQYGTAMQGWLSWFAIAAELGLPIEIYGDGEQERDILDIQDLCQLVEKQVEYVVKLRGLLVNDVGGGPENVLSPNRVTELLCSKYDYTTDDREVPQRAGDIRSYVSDNAAVSANFGWQPTTSAKECLSRIVAWVKEHREELAGMYGAKAHAAS